MTRQGVKSQPTGSETMRIFARGIISLSIFFFSALLLGPPVCSGKELSISGITEPIGDVTLSTTVRGTIATIFIKEGMPVKKDEVILDLDNKVEALEVDRRRAATKAATARVATLKSNLESTRELYDTTGSVSREELDKLQLEYEVAVSEEERERLGYEQARRILHKLSLRSPIEGTVVKLFLDEGESCEENQPIVQVVDASRGRFVGYVEEQIGRKLKKGQSVDLKIKAGEGYTVKKGVITFVSPVVDPASGLLAVKADFNNSNGSIRPGVSGFMLLRSR